MNKRQSIIKNNKGFFSFLGLLLAIAIICYLFYLLLNTYFKKPTLDKDTEKSLNEQGISVSNYRSVLETTRNTVKGIEKEAQDREKQAFGDRQ